MVKKNCNICNIDVYWNNSLGDLIHSYQQVKFKSQ